MEKLEAVEAVAPESAAEKEAMQKELDAKAELLKEEESRSASLAADLEEAQATVEELETDAHHLWRTNVYLVTERNQARDNLEAAREEKAAKLESALVKQKTELERKYGAEFDTALAEGVREVTAKYKGQLHRIWDRAWEIGWKAALKKVGVPADDPIFRDPPKFPSSDSALLSVMAPSPTSCSFSEVPPVALEVHPAPLDAAAEAGPASPQGIDCNKEVAAP